MGMKTGISFLWLWGVIESKLLWYWKDRVHGQCLRTWLGPHPLPSPTPPVMFAAHTVQHSDLFPPLPASPQCHFPAALIHYPFSPFFPFCLSLMNMWASPLHCKASQSANTLDSSWPVLSAHMTSAAALPHTARGCVSFSLAQSSSSGTLGPGAWKGNVPMPVLIHFLRQSITEKLGKAQQWDSLGFYFVCNIFNAGIGSGPPSFTSFLSDV